MRSLFLHLPPAVASQQEVLTLNGKFVCYIVAVCAMIVVSPPAAIADCGDHHSKKGWFEKFMGKGDREHGHDHGKHRKCKKKKCHWKKHSAGMFWWRSSSTKEVLRLDDSQVSLLDEISKSHREKVMDAYNKVAEAKIAYKKVKMSGSSTTGEIRAVWRAKHEAKMEKEAAKLEMFLEMREVLTPDQREELTLMKAHKGKGKRGCGGKKKH